MKKLLFVVAALAVSTVKAQEPCPFPLTPGYEPPILTLHPTASDVNKNNVKVEAVTTNGDELLMDLFINGVLVESAETSDLTYRWNTQKRPFTTNLWLCACDGNGNCGIVTFGGSPT